MTMNKEVAAKKRPGSVISAALFIAATCIGLSYFTIPILTGIAGFVPAVVMTLLVWIFCLAVGLLYSEATLGQPDGANLASISRVLLGKVWMVILSVIFFITMISYLMAYTFFTEQFLHWWFKDAFNIHLSRFVSGLLSTLPFLLIIFLGLSFSCNANALLMVGLLISFFLTIFVGSANVVPTRLVEQQWVYIFFSVPILFSSLGFSAIMPPVCTYLNRDPKKIRLSVFLGTLITLIVYLVWQWLMIGSLSAGTFWVNFEEGANMEKVFALIKKFPYTTYFFNFTLFFSMITSFVGMGTATVEFLCDAFKIPLSQRRGWKRLGFCALLFVIVLPFSLIKERPFVGFIQDFAAPLGEVMINGIIPVWMVAQARYVYSIKAPQLLPGGRISLIVLGIALFILIYLEGITFIRS